MQLSKIASTMKLDKIGDVAVKAMGSNYLKVKAASPEILLGAGIVGIVGGTVLACRATLKIGDILDESKAINTQINDVVAQDREDYTKKDASRDKLILMTKTAVRVGRLYLPSIVVFSLSIGALVGSHAIVKGRNAALVAAYGMMESAYNDYRGRVIEEYGEEKDYDYRHGLETTTKSTKTEDGKTKKTTVRKPKKDVNAASPYSYLFDQTTSKYWNEAYNGYNVQLVLAQQNWANDKLASQGHLFLNEVFDMLGMERTKEGQLVGWMKDGKGDNFVDFGLELDQQGELFRAGVNDYVLLNFNVDGLITDFI